MAEAIENAVEASAALGLAHALPVASTILLLRRHSFIMTIPLGPVGGLALLLLHLMGLLHITSPLDIRNMMLVVLLSKGRIEDLMLLMPRDFDLLESAARLFCVGGRSHGGRR
jgi:hypothetical protein